MLLKISRYQINPLQNFPSVFLALFPTAFPAYYEYIGIIC